VDVLIAVRETRHKFGGSMIYFELVIYPKIAKFGEWYKGNKYRFGFNYTKLGYTRRELYRGKLRYITNSYLHLYFLKWSRTIVIEHIEKEPL